MMERLGAKYITSFANQDVFGDAQLEIVVSRDDKIQRFELTIEKIHS
jgi:hypothetical protein